MALRVAKVMDAFWASNITPMYPARNLFLRILAFFYQYVKLI